VETEVQTKPPGIVHVERQTHCTYLVLQREALSALLAAGGRFLLEESTGEDRPP
jgi:hypothetical protein